MKSADLSVKLKSGKVVLEFDSPITKVSYDPETAQKIGEAIVKLAQTGMALKGLGPDLEEFSSLPPKPPGKSSR